MRILPITFKKPKLTTNAKMYMYRATEKHKWRRMVKSKPKAVLHFKVDSVSKLIRLKCEVCSLNSSIDGRDNCFSIYTIILLFCGCNLGICVYAAKMGDLSWIDYRNPKVFLWSHIDFTSPHLFYKPCWVNFTIDSLDWSVQVNSCTVQLYTRPENLSRKEYRWTKL